MTDYYYYYCRCKNNRLAFAGPSADWTLGKSRRTRFPIRGEIKRNAPLVLASVFRLIITEMFFFFFFPHRWWDLETKASRPKACVETTARNTITDDETAAGRPRSAGCLARLKRQQIPPRPERIVSNGTVARPRTSSLSTPSNKKKDFRIYLTVWIYFVWHSERTRVYLLTV